MIRIMAIVSSIDILLRALPRAPRTPCATRDVATKQLSNGCATRGRSHQRGPLSRLCSVVAVVLALSSSVWAQEAVATQKPSDEQPTASIPAFLAGAAIGLGAHESG